jgi:hypothetical protein
MVRKSTRLVKVVIDGNITEKTKAYKYEDVGCNLLAYKINVDLEKT